MLRRSLLSLPLGLQLRFRVQNFCRQVHPRPSEVRVECFDRCLVIYADCVCRASASICCPGLSGSLMRVEDDLSLGAPPLLLLATCPYIADPYGYTFPFSFAPVASSWRIPYPRKYGCEMVAFLPWSGCAQLLDLFPTWVGSSPSNGPARLWSGDL